ncbi:AAA family ATPase [Flavobacterium sp. DGU38]|uniref:AAA family ATPase n=1 Tax=Flavobacterium calami TaxID=3139144 RepID=A0ABU9IRI6_9FLAO
MTLDFLKGGAIVGVVIGFWDKIKAFLWKFISIIIQRVEIKTDEAHDSVIAYLVKDYKKLQTYDRAYGATNETFRSGKYGLVPFEKFGTTSIIFLTKKKYLGIPIPFVFNHVEENKTQENRYQEPNSNEKTYSTITCLRGSLDLDEIIENSSKMRNKISWQIEEEEEGTNRFDIFYLPNKDTNNHAYFSKNTAGYAWYKQKQYRLLGVNSDDLGREMSTNGKALDNLFFPKEIKELISIISLWVKSRDWYKEKNIPWKRGWLLYGPPGTGKTALVRAFAEDLNMPIYVFSLSQMSNNDLMSSWKNMQLNIPCIALIEDIDNVFHGRKNICQNNGMISRLLTSDDDANNDDNSGAKFTPLTFDCLLNCLDGVDKSNGIFTIITTNDVTKIDSAIGQPSNENGKETFVSSRPGRIDKAIELTYMLKENKVQMANKILSDFPDELKKVLLEIEKDNKETPAQFQEYCSQIAIQEYWKQKENSQ